MMAATTPSPALTVPQSQACYNCREVGHLSAGFPKPQAPRAQRIKRMVTELSEEEKQEVEKDF